VLQRNGMPATERDGVYQGLARGDSLRVIAGRLGRWPSTVSREVARNGGRRRYRAVDAEDRAWRPADHNGACWPAESHCGSCSRRSWRPTGRRSGSADTWLVPARRNRDAGEPRDDLQVLVRADPRGAGQTAAEASALASADSAQHPPRRRRPVALSGHRRRLHPAAAGRGRRPCDPARGLRHGGAGAADRPRPAQPARRRPRSPGSGGESGHGGGTLQQRSAFLFGDPGPRQAQFPLQDRHFHAFRPVSHQQTRTAEAKAC
jgi:Helix-turn-helix domain